ncbi:MAG: tRNA pseudouridine(38-40) synthase TruA [Flavobacteriales bacterium]
MSKFFLEIQYQGANYHGWQIQENAHTVQAEINAALSTYLQEEINVIGCGRTDTGVHAKNYYAHFETEKPVDTQQLTYKLNCILPKDIACSNAFPVNEGHHARFSATSRTYEYWIINTKNPFYINFAYYNPATLNVGLMNKAAKLLIQKTDFSCFSKSNTDTLTNNCNVTFAQWEIKNDLLVFTITADRFLRNMVRAIVGTLLDVGQEKTTVDEIHKIIASKNRSNAGTSVPAHGLYLTKVTYPFLNN